MAGLREIQGRIRSIEDTRKITGAMYMISSTKLKKAKKDLEKTEPYFYMLQLQLLNPGHNTQAYTIVPKYPAVHAKYANDLFFLHFLFFLLNTHDCLQTYAPVL